MEQQLKDLIDRVAATTGNTTLLPKIESILKEQQEFVSEVQSASSLENLEQILDARESQLRMDIELIRMALSATQMKQEAEARLQGATTMLVTVSAVQSNLDGNRLLRDRGLDPMFSAEYLTSLLDNAKSNFALIKAQLQLQQFVISLYSEKFDNALKAYKRWRSIRRIYIATERMIWIAIVIGTFKKLIGMPFKAVFYLGWILIPIALYIAQQRFFDPWLKKRLLRRQKSNLSTAASDFYAEYVKVILSFAGAKLIIDDSSIIDNQPVTDLRPT
jgi:hypothetical protein